MKCNVAAVAFGLTCVAIAASAASHIAPVEATAPPDAAVPAAENVETVLRATYVLPADRGEALATFLKANAAPGIDVRAERRGGSSSTVSLTIIAPAAEQKALGTFIAKCVNKEPGTATPTLAPVPDYADPPSAAERRNRQEESPFYGSPPSQNGFGPLPSDGFASPSAKPSTVRQRTN